jgi:hypothetical protein
MGGKSPDKPKATAGEKELARRGVEDWNQAAKQLPGLEDRFVENVRADGSARGRAASQASGAAAERFGSKERGLQRITKTGAAAPRAALGIAGDVNAGAAARGKSIGQANLDLDGRELSGLLKPSEAGRGLQDQADLSSAKISRAATQSAISEEKNEMAMTRGLISGAASGAGMYVSTKDWLDGGGGKGGGGKK